SSGINHARSVNNDAKDTWHKYGDPENFGEFLFDKVKLPASRFTDGSVPVWYGAEDSTTSLLEIEFHLKIDTQKEVSFGYIDYERAMCLAELEMKKNSDVKFLATSLADYKEKSSYPACLKELEKQKKLGATSLTYSSARNAGKECYAITEKNEIHSSVVKNFFRLRVYADPAKATDVAEIILEE
ncbi:MAG: RES family NAD+ phosphorylase, partial [Bacteriovorax sp.]|nr:RES family NAD+ phosphorylase [Bacteriovorax sp.]